MKLNLVEEKVSSELEIILVKNKIIKQDKDILEKVDFKGEEDSSALLAELGKLYIGCGESTSDNIRVAVAAAMRIFAKTNFKEASIDGDEYLREVIEGIELGSYQFTKYKSKKDEKKEKTIHIVVTKVDEKTIEVFEDAVNLSNSVNMVRDFVNTTPEDFYPKIMAKKAKKIAIKNDLEIKIFGEKYLQSNHMGAMLAVGRASRHGSRLIHLTYKPQGEIKKKIVLIGKGLTYDSGGLSLKPADFMVTMKSDKSGGSAVLGIMNAVAKMKLPIEVHGIVGAVENMIGGDAYKPDDVLVAKNGKTIEVRNTDAEGRLVLADCLCYAQDEIKDFDYMIDYATLTGACVVGVGHYTTGIMGNNLELNNQLQQSAIASGELATVLHFNKYLKKTLKSKIADICNISNTRYGGAITAGMFLDEFVKEENKQKWVHCDIAGPAFVEEVWGCNPEGASGAGVRFTVEFFKNFL